MPADEELVASELVRRSGTAILNRNSRAFRNETKNRRTTIRLGPSEGRGRRYWTWPKRKPGRRITVVFIGAAVTEPT